MGCKVMHRCEVAHLACLCTWPFSRLHPSCPATPSLQLSPIALPPLPQWREARDSYKQRAEAATVAKV